METACIEWAGAKNTNGYGVRRKYGVTALVHRDTWISNHGPIPSGLVVMHKCDNRLCFNADHLRLGTQLENLEDMRAKGRGTVPALMPGSSNPTSKLSDDQVRLIKGRLNEPFSRLGKEFGVSRSTISLIAHGKTWAHIQMETE